MSKAGLKRIVVELPLNREKIILTGAMNYGIFSKNLRPGEKNFFLGDKSLFNLERW